MDSTLSSIIDIDVKIICMLDEISLSFLYETDKYLRTVFSIPQFLFFMKQKKSYFPLFRDGSEFYTSLLQSIQNYNKTIFFNCDTDFMNQYRDLEICNNLESRGYKIFLPLRDGFMINKFSNITYPDIQIILKLFNYYTMRFLKIVIDISNNKKGYIFGMLHNNKISLCTRFDDKRDFSSKEKIIDYISNLGENIDKNIKNAFINLPRKQSKNKLIKKINYITDILFGNLLCENMQQLIDIIHKDETVNQIVINYRNNYDIIDKFVKCEELSYFF